MSLNRGLRGSPQPPGGGGGGLPAWIIFLIAVAFVLGAFYLLQGAQNFIRTGGLGVDEATARAEIVATATAVRVTRMATVGFTPQPTATPIPECIDFRVSVPNAIVRAEPSANAAVSTSFNSGQIACVLGRAPENPEWYQIDEDTSTRRREYAYMHESVIEAVNPTLTPTRTYTPSITPTPLPTVTPLPMIATFTPTWTASPIADSRATLPGPANTTSTPTMTNTTMAITVTESPLRVATVGPLVTLPVALTDEPEDALVSP